MLRYGFPRTRGDLPDSSNGCNVRIASPPARAGIYPPAWSCHHGIQSLPRTRGDLPARPTTRLRADPSPPHARGSARPVCRFFRTRVDPPTFGNSARIVSRVPPHTRASAARGQISLVRPGAFPARAGINRSLYRPYSRPGRLPRTRGDQPWGLSSNRTESWSSPHARGSAHVAGDERSVRRGSPARAGICLASDCRCMLRCELPRTRRDLPRPSHLCRDFVGVFPHARGSAFIVYVVQAQEAVRAF